MIQMKILRQLFKLANIGKQQTPHLIPYIEKMKKFAVSGNPMYHINAKYLARHINKANPNIKIKWNPTHQYRNLEISQNLSPNAMYRSEMFKNRQNIPVPGHFLHTRKTPMIDIDIGTQWHNPAQLVHKTKRDAVKAIADVSKSKAAKGAAFKVYETPGGIRAYDLSTVANPTQYKKIGLDTAMGVDPWYQGFNLKRGEFASRLMPKPGREGDYVAKNLGLIRKGKVLKPGDPIGDVNPQSVLDVKRYHDNMIKHILKADKKKRRVPLHGLLKYVDDLP